MNRLASAAALACLLALSSAQAADRTVLVVPAQNTLVNFAFDLAAMFPDRLDMASYDVPAGAQTPRLYVFDRTAWRWVEQDAAAWQSGSGLRPGASRVVLVGGDPSIRGLVSAPWITQSQTVDGRRLHEVANAVSRDLGFTPAQWQRLAQAYGFKLEDRNADARRQSRYDRPRPPRAAAPAAEDAAPAPAVRADRTGVNVIETNVVPVPTPAAETDAPAPTSTETVAEAVPVEAAKTQPAAATAAAPAAPAPEDK